jgi:hypothetical protein
MQDVSAERLGQSPAHLPTTPESWGAVEAPSPSGGPLTDFQGQAG